MSTALSMTPERQALKEAREKIAVLEALMLQMPQIDVPIEHHHAPGMYLREMRAPAGSKIVGKIHKTEHYCILSKGHVTVVTDTGRREYVAPAVIHSPVGVKRALHFHEDSVWINVHHNPTNERDLDKIDQLYVVDHYHELPAHEAPAQIQGGT